MFDERAANANPAFALDEKNAADVVQICKRLDGIPLAIELAAARIKVLSVQEIAARLDDRFSLLTAGSRTAIPRHQTLRATIDWSHDLLTEPERILLRRLSVFAGGFTLEAAEAVCGEGLTAGERPGSARAPGRQIAGGRRCQPRVPAKHATACWRPSDSTGWRNCWPPTRPRASALRHLEFYVRLAEASEATGLRQ